MLPKFQGQVSSRFTIFPFSVIQTTTPQRVKFLEAQIATAAEGATHLITDSVVLKEVIEYFGVDESPVTSVPLAARAISVSNGNRMPGHPSVITVGV